MGMLWAYDGAALLDPASWHKSKDPVYKTDESARIYGPGHNSFTVGEDGSDILVFHARNFKEIKGNPLEDTNRHTHVKVFEWNEGRHAGFSLTYQETAWGRSLTILRLMI